MVRLRFLLALLLLVDSFHTNFAIHGQHWLEIWGSPREFHHVLVGSCWVPRLLENHYASLQFFLPNPKMFATVLLVFPRYCCDACAQPLTRNLGIWCHMLLPFRFVSWHGFLGKPCCFMTDGGAIFLPCIFKLLVLNQELLAPCGFHVQFFWSNVLVKPGLRKPVPRVVRCFFRHPPLVGLMRGLFVHVMRFLNILLIFSFFNQDLLCPQLFLSISLPQLFLSMDELHAIMHKSDRWVKEVGHPGHLGKNPHDEHGPRRLVGQHVL